VRKGGSRRVPKGCRGRKKHAYSQAEGKDGGSTIIKSCQRENAIFIKSQSKKRLIKGEEEVMVQGKKTKDRGRQLGQSALGGIWVREKSGDSKLDLSFSAQ